SGFEAFQMPDDLEHKSVRLTAPASLKVAKLISGNSSTINEKTNSSSSSQQFDWEAAKVKAMPAESQLPPEWIYLPGVSYFAGDLQAYLKELNDAMVDRSHKSAKVAAATRQLLGETKGKVEAVKAIRDFVAKSIRTAGPSFSDLPLSELSDADTTL